MFIIPQRGSDFRVWSVLGRWNQICRASYFVRRGACTWINLVLSFNEIRDSDPAHSALRFVEFQGSRGALAIIPRRVVYSGFISIRSASFELQRRTLFLSDILTHTRAHTQVA